MNQAEYELRNIKHYSATNVDMIISINYYTIFFNYSGIILKIELHVTIELLYNNMYIPWLVKSRTRHWESPLIRNTTFSH